MTLRCRIDSKLQNLKPDVISLAWFVTSVWPKLLDFSFDDECPIRSAHVRAGSRSEHRPPAPGDCCVAQAPCLTRRQVGEAETGCRAVREGDEGRRGKAS